MKLPDICFVAQEVYPLLSESHHLSIGGAELQQVCLARELAHRGYRVSFITKNYGQRMVKKIGPFDVFSSFDPKDGIPVIRFFYPRLYQIYKALDRTRADIFYVRSASFILGIVVHYAHRRGKKVVYCGADDRNFDPALMDLPTIRDKWLYQWGIPRSDAIVVQNRTQRQSLKKNYRKDGILIHNALPSLSPQTLNSFNQDINQKRNNILWVSNIRQKKQPHVLLKLARRFPEEKFVMIGGEVPRERPLYYRIKEEAEKINNVQFRGFVPLKTVHQEFCHAKVLINTSLFEGFPNTFLQAWRCGTPVISFIDPDQLISRLQLGYVASDFREMALKLKHLLHQSKISADLIQNAFRKNFDIEQAANRYESIFHQLMPQGYEKKNKNHVCH